MSVGGFGSVSASLQKGIELSIVPLHISFHLSARRSIGGPGGPSVSPFVVPCFFVESCGKTML